LVVAVAPGMLVVKLVVHVPSGIMPVAATVVFVHVSRLRPPFAAPTKACTPLLDGTNTHPRISWPVAAVGVQMVALDDDTTGTPDPTDTKVDVPSVGRYTLTA